MFVTSKQTEITLPDSLSPSCLKRLIPTTLNRLGGLVPNLTVEPHPDGRVSITLPLQWASLLLANLQAQAADFREKLEKAAWQAHAKEIELQTSLAQARREWETKETAVYASYKRLLKRGVTHREALHRLKKGDLWTITMLQDVVEKGGARERRQQRTKRDARVFDLVNQEIGRRKVSKQLGLTISQVKGAVCRERRRRHVLDATRKGTGRTPSSIDRV